MLDVLPRSFQVGFDENNQEFSIAGLMRPQSAGDLKELAATFHRSTAAVRGTLYVNVKRLVRLNNIAFRALTSLLVKACEGDDRGSCLPLAMRYQAGVGVPKDPARAKTYYARACDAGITLACMQAR